MAGTGQEHGAPQEPSEATTRLTPEQLRQFAASQGSAPPAPPGQAAPPQYAPPPAPPGQAAPPQAPAAQYAPPPAQYGPQPGPEQYAPPPAPGQAPPGDYGQQPLQYAPQPGYDAPPGQVQGQHTGVQLKTSFFFLAFILFLFPPTVVVNGYEQKISWGSTWLPLQPGSYRLEVFFRYLFFGAVARSAVDIVVHPGQVQQWQWKAPWFVWSKGKWQQQG